MPGRLFENHRPPHDAYRTHLQTRRQFCVQALIGGDHGPQRPLTFNTACNAIDAQVQTAVGHLPGTRPGQPSLFPFGTLGPFFGHRLVIALLHQMPMQQHTAAQ
ncbi:hypothetical protein D3C78_1597500 [compost metagenome]